MKAFNRRDIPADIRALLGRNTRKSPYTKAELQLLQDWYEGVAAGDELPVAGEGALLWSRIQAALETSDAAQVTVLPRRPLYVRMWKVAAAAAVLLAMGWWGWRYYHPVQPVYDEQLATVSGKTRQVTLPDGTQVWLNVNSRLRYSKDWAAGGQREVELSGEAFFEVAQVAHQPFVIHTSAVDVQVLGTSFNLKAYPEDATVETTLLTGKVAVVLKQRRDQRMELRPREKLVVLNPAAARKVAVLPEQAVLEEAGYMLGAAVQQPGDSICAEVSWKEGRLTFFNEHFEQIALQLERWYDVKITFKDEALKALRFTGSFRGESLPKVMEALQYSNTFHYDISGGELTIYK